MDKLSKLGKLQHKFYNSGMLGNPIISDKELNSLSQQLGELSLYFKDRHDSTIASVLRIEQESVERMITARETAKVMQF